MGGPAASPLLPDSWGVPAAQAPPSQEFLHLYEGEGGPVTRPHEAVEDKSPRKEACQLRK